MDAVQLVRWHPERRNVPDYDPLNGSSTSGVRIAAVTHGLSNTLAASEVKVLTLGFEATNRRESDHRLA